MRIATNSARRSIRSHSRASGTKLILCAGLKSSGSTWLYNAVIQLCELANGRERTSSPPRKIAAFYADRIEDFPQGMERRGLLIVKTHIPSKSLVFLSAFVGAPVFITVREPRDAIVSLMNRFGHGFETSLEEVSRGAERLIELSQIGQPLVWRYERDFVSRPDTVERLREKLGLTVSPSSVRQIASSLKAENVERKIAALEKKGAFGVRPHPDRFDAKTHWHPGHIGDRRIGKYTDVLSTRMQKRVLCAMANYCAKFGYPATLP